MTILITPIGDTENVKIPASAKRMLAELAIQNAARFPGCSAPGWRAGLAMVLQGYFDLEPSEKLARARREGAAATVTRRSAPAMPAAPRGCPAEKESDLIDRL